MHESFSKRSRTLSTCSCSSYSVVCVDQSMLDTTADEVSDRCPYSGQWKSPLPSYDSNPETRHPLTVIMSQNIRNTPVESFANEDLTGKSNQEIPIKLITTLSSLSSFSPFSPMVPSRLSVQTLHTCDAHLVGWTCALD